MTIEYSTTKTASTLLITLKDELSALNRLKEGDVVEAILLKNSPRHAFFDLGKFGTGIVYGAEIQNARGILKNMSLGDRIPAKINELDGRMGYVELSLSEAGKQKLWQQAQAFEESGELTKAKVTAANQGGLVLDLFGLKAFLPVSQLAPEHAPKVGEMDRQSLGDELKKLVGTECTIKVINVNARANKLIVSEREGSGTSSHMKEALTKYAVGQTVDGLVSGIADFGIFVRFVDNPDIEGLVHISEIDHKLIDNPKESVTLNESVKVKILDIREGRVFLSLKALRADPWATLEGKLTPGEAVTGSIYKFNPFGAIVDVGGGIQGMIHVSEFGSLDEMKKALVLKESYPFVIVSIKPEEKRLILKLKK